MDMNSMALKSVLKYIVLPILVLAGAAFYRYCPWFQQDNPVEEHIEYVIEAYTGEDVDLSPETKESR